MKSLIAVFALLAVANAGLVLQGPSARASVVGPDGSAISSVSPGGTVVAEQSPAFVAATGPVVAPPAVVAATPVVASAPVLAPASVVAARSIVAPGVWGSPAFVGRSIYW